MHGTAIKISLLVLYILPTIIISLMNLLDRLSEKIKTECLPETLLTTKSAAVPKMPLSHQRQT
jgi:hypothetical protein